MIGITGVTGNLGGLLAEELSKKGVAARHIARSPERAKRYDNAELVKASYEDSAESVAALTGVDVLFMVSAKEGIERLDEHKGFISAAKKAGVSHIVYTSFYDAKLDSTFTLARDHAATEQFIKKQGLTYTFIRDNFYLEFFIGLLDAYGEIKGPAGSGKCSAVSRRDVSAVAVQILKNPKAYANQTLNMTGPEALSMQEIADKASKKRGQKYSYISETVKEAYQSRKAWPAQDWEYDSWVSTYTAIAKGELKGLSHDIETILGRPATSLDDLL
ncbi:SDR family oxidoreductase [Streptococcus dentiloxodontae]